MKTPNQIKELPWETGMTPNERKIAWWYHYVVVNYYNTKEFDRKPKFWDGDTLRYCKECDTVWEFGSRMYDKYSNFRTRRFYTYKRDVIPFYGFIKHKEKHKICIKCKKGDRDE